MAAPSEPPPQRRTRRDVDERIQRAQTQRLFLIAQRAPDPTQPQSRRFDVLGTSGTVYMVEISPTPTCTCPDARLRGRPCKHVLFVLLRVLGVAENAPVLARRTFSPADLEAIFAAVAAKRPTSETTAPTPTPTSPRSSGADDVCPICYEPLGDEARVWCRTGCGNPAHQICFDSWASWCVRTGQPPTCVYCRRVWGT